MNSPKKTSILLLLLALVFMFSGCQQSLEKKFYDCIKITCESDKGVELFEEYLIELASEREVDIDFKDTNMHLMFLARGSYYSLTVLYNTSSFTSEEGFMMMDDLHEIYLMLNQMTDDFDFDMDVRISVHLEVYGDNSTQSVFEFSRDDRDDIEEVFLHFINANSEYDEYMDNMFIGLNTMLEAYGNLYDVELEFETLLLSSELYFKEDSNEYSGSFVNHSSDDMHQNRIDALIQSLDTATDNEYVQENEDG